jgi:hypothetical protein
MSRVGLIGRSLSFMLVSISGLTRGQDPSPQPGNEPAAPTSRSRASKTETSGSTGSPDYKILVWFDTRRPLDTFQSQPYDLRRSQYTQAVDDWLKVIKTQYPTYKAYTRNVYLARESGANDREKVGSAIVRELMVTASYYGGVDPAGLGLIGSRGLPALPFSTPPRLLTPVTPPQPFGSIGRANFPGPDLSPQPPLFPVPMPYPRPHP